jgi:tetratricopeptide (TPR) repeat protein
MLLCMALGACTTVPSFEQPQDISQQALLDVPFFPQQDYYCGPAALAEVANFRNVETDQDAVASKTFIPGRKGSLAIEMSAATRQLGLLPYPLEKEFGALLSELDAGNPVLVLQNLGFGWYPKWHYALAVGYRLGDNTLILHSGEQRNYEIPFATFIRTWQRADQWARVVVDSTTVPTTAEPLRYLRSALAFEQTGRPELAYVFYQQALDQWPKEPAVLTAAANAALNTGDSRRARNLFESLLRNNPKEPNIWNNYAYALQADGCDMAASMAISVAVQLAPDEEAFKQSAKDFSSGRGFDPEHCPQPDGPLPF